jgi:hypothetical protein
MTPLSRLPWRLVVASLGFLAAVLASLAVILAAVGLVPALDLARFEPTAPAVAGFLDRALRGAALVPAMASAVWPAWFVAAVVVEIAGLRSLALHVFGFAALALLALVAAMPAAPPALLQLATAAGFVAGFAHWLVAGRSAGVADRAPDAVAGKGDPQPPHA